MAHACGKPWRQPRPEEQRLLLRLDGMARYAQFAVTHGVPALADKQQSFAARETALNQRLHQVYCEALRTPAARTAFRLVVREATWRHLGQRCGWFMAWPVWVRGHVSTVWTSYQLGRLALKGVSMFGLLGVALSAFVAALRGVIPLQQIISALGPTYRQHILDMQQDVRWIMEDHGLAAWLDTAPAPEPSTPVAAEAWASTLPAVGNVLAQALHHLLPTADDALLAQLQADVEHSGEQIAQACTSSALGRVLLGLANLLPAGMLGWILSRLSTAWWRYEYLPWPFYGMALTLFLGSFVPGFLLLSWHVHVRVTQVDAAQLVSQVDRPSVTMPLRLVRQHLGQFLARAQRLGQLLRETQQTLVQAGGVTPAAFGAVHQEDPAPRP